jgi:hypothetical protein
LTTSIRGHVFKLLHFVLSQFPSYVSWARFMYLLVA